MVVCFFFFFKQKTAYEMRISDWSSDVCSSDLRWPGRSGSIEGRQVSCGGDSLLCFLLKASTAPQARRREGLKPNGRDSKDGTGHSPKSPAARSGDTRYL